MNGGYTEWNGWSPCSVTCGRGIKKRQRFCTNPEPAYGGVACGHLGSGEEIVQCYDVNCPGEWLLDYMSNSSQMRLARLTDKISYVFMRLSLNSILLPSQLCFICFM